MEFKILIDDSLIGVLGDTDLHPIENKKVLSIVNDFEGGAWRDKKFHQFIWNNIALTALSEKERQSLVGEPATILSAAAQHLRISSSDEDSGRGGEIAEILLYGIMHHHFNALPVVPKIFYKQNANDFAKGADSVHIVVGEDDFTIWFGEAKFYNSIENARLGSIVQSVENSLLTEKLKKENSIITNLKDIDELDIDVEMRERIKSMLDNRESIDTIKPKLHIPILLLHECSITTDASELDGIYVEQIKEHHADRAKEYFSKQIAKFATTVHKYSDITFHIILFPVPSKEPIVESYEEKAAMYKST